MPWRVIASFSIPWLSPEGIHEHGAPCFADDKGVPGKREAIASPHTCVPQNTPQGLLSFSWPVFSFFHNRIPQVDLQQNCEHCISATAAGTVRKELVIFCSKYHHRPFSIKRCRRQRKQWQKYGYPDNQLIWNRC